MPGTVAAAVGAALAVFFALHIAIWRLAPSNAPRISVLGILAVLAMAASLGISVALSGGNVYTAFAVLWIDVFCIVGYTFFYAGLARSVSVTVLERLLASRTPAVDFQTLVAEYAASSRFEDRIRLMHEAGFVTIRADNSVFVTPKGLRLGRCARLLGQAVGRGLRG